jgi:hypothetical protein
MITWDEFLKLPQLNTDITQWAATYTNPTDAWNACERADWMLDMASTANLDSKRIVAAECRCVRTVLQYIPEPNNDSEKAIDITEGWCNGTKTVEQVRTAAFQSYTYFRQYADKTFVGSFACCAATCVALSVFTNHSVWKFIDEASQTYLSAFPEHVAKLDTLKQRVDLIREAIPAIEFQALFAV